MTRRSVLFLLLSVIFISFGCGDDDSVNESGVYGVFSSMDSNTAVMNGTIGSDTPEDWDDYVEAFPMTNRIIMRQCPGSEDDDANLEASRKIKQQNVTIHLESNSEIASGAVDMYLAGNTRTRELGSRIGVHSWSDGTNDATAFPVGNQEHSKYIDYYVEMGFSQREAEDFYYFTINAAPADDIHWMTDAEIVQFKLLTE